MKNFNISFDYFSKIFIFLLVICLMMGVIQVSTGYREEILRQEQELFLENEDYQVNYYYDDFADSIGSDNMAINNMIDCYRSGSKDSNMDKVIGNIVLELDSLFSNNRKAFSFLYYDLFSGFTVAYNEDSPIFTASIIKAPAVIYIYEMASRGLVNLDEELLYTSNFYRGGTGVLKNKPVNTKYTIEELIQYTIYDSDNIAYSMLMDRFGRESIRDFWKGKGAQYMFTTDTIWGYMSANDAVIYMRELYNFSLENEEYGEKLLKHFKKARWKVITDRSGKFNTANKGGWSGTSLHDVAIVFDENPYVLIIMSNMGESSYISHFNKTSKLVGELHYEYWKYKNSVCSSIKLY